MEEKIITFLKDYELIIIPAATFAVGWLLPSPFLEKIAKKIIDVTPDKLEPLLISKLDFFVNSLKKASVNGNNKITSNEQIDIEYKNLKTDLGFTSQSKKTGQ